MTGMAVSFDFLLKTLACRQHAHQKSVIFNTVGIYGCQPNTQQCLLAQPQVLSDASSEHIFISYLLKAVGVV
jgi:hypothetical protein